MTRSRKPWRGRPLLEFGGIEPNPRYETLMQGGRSFAGKEKVGFLLVGRAAVRCWMAPSSSPWPPCIRRATLGHPGQGSPAEQALPLGCVLTLPATGSEMNMLRRHFPRVHPREAGLCATRWSIRSSRSSIPRPPSPCRERQTSNGMADAFVHVMEQYLTYPPTRRSRTARPKRSCTPSSRKARRSCKQPRDYAARANLDVGRHPGPQRPDRLRRAPGLDHPHDRPRADRLLRPGPRPNPGGGVARGLETPAGRQSEEADPIRRTRLGPAHGKDGAARPSTAQNNSSARSA